MLCGVLLISFSAEAQINKYRQNSEESEEGQENQDQQAIKEKSALSPDTAKTLIYRPNIYASYSQDAYKATLHGFQRYNSLQNSDEKYAHLGNPGSASSPITFSTKHGPQFINVKDAYEPYRYSIDDIRFMVLEKPFSELNYVMGKAKEQQLLFSHSQQVRKGLTLGLHARYLNSPGLYLRQRTYYATGYFTMTYLTPSKRYGVLAAYLNDRLKNYENGGIMYDTVFSKNTESNRKTINVNLSSAANRSRTSGVLLQHYFNLQKIITQTNDSFQQTRKRFDAGRLVHTFRYERRTYAYQDDKPGSSITNGFYPTVFGDSTLTLDSSYHSRIENYFVYSNISPDTSGRNFPFQYAFGISHQVNQVGFDVWDQTNKLLPYYAFNPKELVSQTQRSQQFQQLIPFGTLKGIIARKTYFIADGYLSLGGYNSGDYELKGRFYQYFGDPKSLKRISLSASLGMKHPDYFFSHYLSNHFQWDKNALTQEFLDAKAKIEWSGIELEASFHRISNYAWLNEKIEATQSSDPLSVFRADASKIFRLGRWIFDTHVTFQQCSNDSILSLPSVVANGSVSYSRLLFNKVLLAEIGVNCLYYTSYYADAYMPALRMFYRQNEEKFGNYPYLDAFINLKVKRARIFVQYQHMNAGWMGYTYIMTPHYPGADGAFKAGVSWVFYD